MASAKDRALSIAMRYGQSDDAAEKAWVIDQMVRLLTGDGYAKWVAGFQRGEHGPDTYAWNLGVDPSLPQRAKTNLSGQAAPNG